MIHRLKKIVGLSMPILLAIPAPVNAGFFDRFSFFSNRDVCGRVNVAEATWYAKAACLATAACAATAAVAGYLGFNYWKNLQETKRLNNTIEQEKQKEDEERSENNSWSQREMINLSLEEIQELKKENKMLKTAISQLQKSNASILEKNNNAYKTQRDLVDEINTLKAKTEHQAQQIKQLEEENIRLQDLNTRTNKCLTDWRNYTVTSGVGNDYKF